MIVTQSKNITRLAPRLSLVSLNNAQIDSGETALKALIRDQQLSAYFQPILDMHSHQYLGYEALIRGPVSSELHMPAALFKAAGRGKQRQALEHACRATAMRDFSASGLQGKLFINLSASMLNDPVLMQPSMLQIMLQQGLRPDQIVIEITENQKIRDFSAFRETLAKYRLMGYSFAIDDLGEGFSNLRMWSEIRPEYVKIDRHFISGIDTDVLKFRLVRAMIEIAEACHATLIAEGIEEEAEFVTIRDLGIRCGQGYLICTPQALPPIQPAEKIVGLLEEGRISVFPQGATSQLNATVAPLLKCIEPASPGTDNEAVFKRFDENKNLHALPVVENGIPVGMINRHTLIERFAKPYHRELYGKRPCAQFMDKNPLVVPQDMSVPEVATLLGNAKRHQVNDGFILTDKGYYLGIADTQDLMVQITEMQIRSARYANPLTQLPGNVPVNEHTDRLLKKGNLFTACYVDIDHFKPYNDIYGYRRGDEIIQMLGRILVDTCNERLDFVGHIGGDDFVILLQTPDWQLTCQGILDKFSREIRHFISAEDLARDGLMSTDRRGNPAFHPLPSISIGCVVVGTTEYGSINELSAALAEAKKQSKNIPGNSIFIERRHPAKDVISK